MMIGEDYKLSTLGRADRKLKSIFRNLMIKHIRLDASILQVVRYEMKYNLHEQPANH